MFIISVNVRGTEEGVVVGRGESSKGAERRGEGIGGDADMKRKEDKQKEDKKENT